MATEDEDRRLLRACLDGRPGAWEAFVDRFAAPLAEACRRTLARSGRPSGSQEAADMVQEVFLHLLGRDLRVLRDYRGQAPLEAYLAAVAVFKVLKDRQLKYRPMAEGPVPETPGAAEVLEGREATEALIREISRLPPRTRAALSLQARGATLKEVGQALGLSEDAAAQLLSRGRAELRERLKES